MFYHTRSVFSYKTLKLLLKNSRHWDWLFGGFVHRLIHFFSVIISHRFDRFWSLLPVSKSLILSNDFFPAKQKSQMKVKDPWTLNTCITRINCTIKIKSFAQWINSNNGVIIIQRRVVRKKNSHNHTRAPIHGDGIHLSLYPKGDD